MSQVSALGIKNLVSTILTNDGDHVLAKFELTTGDQRVIAIPSGQILPLIENLLAQLGKSQTKGDETPPVQTLPTTSWKVGYVNDRANWVLMLGTSSGTQIGFMLGTDELTGFREALEALESEKRLQ